VSVGGLDTKDESIIVDKRPVGLVGNWNNHEIEAVFGQLSDDEEDAEVEKVTKTELCYINGPGLPSSKCLSFPKFVGHSCVRVANNLIAVLGGRDRCFIIF
jgi:hypothetical protein